MDINLAYLLAIAHAAQHGSNWRLAIIKILDGLGGKCSYFSRKINYKIREIFGVFLCNFFASII